VILDVIEHIVSSTYRYVHCAFTVHTQTRHWPFTKTDPRCRTYVDVFGSVMGVYVAVLGLKASNENCTATAKLYLTGTILTADLVWVVYNSIIFLEVDAAVLAEMQ
jgi:hypothetical protein